MFPLKIQITSYRTMFVLILVLFGISAVYSLGFATGLKDELKKIKTPVEEVSGDDPLPPTKKIRTKKKPRKPSKQIIINLVSPVEIATGLFLLKKYDRVVVGK